MRDGILETIEGRPTLRFERELSSPVDRVWQAVSTSSELEQWFPTATQWEPATGEKLEAFGMYGRVLEVDAPVRLAQNSTGTKLTFVHVFDLTVPTAQTAAGWDAYLQKLEALLAGRSLSDKAAFANWDDLHEYYAAEFGVDPTPGRKFWEQFRDSLDLDAS